MAFATGGVISQVIVGDKTYEIHTFTSSGTLKLNTQCKAKCLVAGPGGNGINGSNSTNNCGGGGSAGKIEQSGEIILRPIEYPVVVGTPGIDSSFNGIIGIKGNNAVNALGANSPNGFIGGNTGALFEGGGAAGAAGNGQNGGASGPDSGGDGGPPVTSTTPGTIGNKFGEGGGGAAWITPGHVFYNAGQGAKNGSAATSPAPNTGSGGGGGIYAQATATNGASGLVSIALYGPFGNDAMSDSEESSI